MQWIPRMPISERMAHRTAGVRLRPEASRAGIGITIAALIAMPVLASLKRHEARRNSNLSFTPDCAGIADGCFAEACFFFGF
jgi:hypothetical protein